MPDLNFQIEAAEPVPFAATPLLGFKLRVTNTPPDEAIHTVVLRTQIQIEVTRRHYSAEEQEQLLDLFGEPERWSQTLRNMLWTQAIVTVPQFKDQAVVDLPVPCTFDFNVAAIKYFHGLTAGDLPLIFLFSGTVFYEERDDGLRVAPISWDKEAKFRLPVRVWRELMNTYYPNSAWLNLRKDVFDRLYRYKMQSGIPTWEMALERLLAGIEEPTPS
jgi:Family of unknown function (DUF6084)